MRFLRNLFHYDNILATAFIFIMLFLFKISIENIKFDWLDPITKALDDVELTDNVYSVTETRMEVDDRIVIVNFGNLPRMAIGQQIRNIAKYNPKVIAIDALMPFPKDPIQDTTLANALAEVDNLVLATKGELYTHSTNTFDSLLDPHPMFLQYAQRGLVNLITDGEKEFRVCRTFVPSMNVSKQSSLGKDSVLNAFAVQVASIYDKEKVDKFLARGLEEEYINYTGNIANFNPLDSSHRTIKFTCLDWEDVLNERWENPEEIFAGKIVLMGYLGQNFWDPSWEDKFYTPMNDKVAGKAIPDMFGVVVHANIISMILDEDYVYQIPDFVEYLITIILVFLIVALFRSFYNDLKVWYDGISKLVSIVVAALLMMLILFIFDAYRLKISITIGIAAILLAGDLLEIYFGVAKNLVRKTVTFVKSNVSNKKEA